MRQLIAISATVLIPVIGLGLIVLGILMATDRLLRAQHLDFTPPPASGFLSFYLYRAPYALTSLSCSLPVFLLVIF